MAQTVTTSDKFSLNAVDFAKGIAMAIITPVFFIILTSINAGSLTFDWHAILIAGLSGGMGYLAKNFFTAPSITIKDPTDSQLEAVKDGSASIKIVK